MDTEAKESEEKLLEQTFKARPYQERMIKVCTKKNSIIYLPTGAGKTFIALMVLKNLSAPLFRPIAKNGKRSIFVVNTRLLAVQQANAIRQATGLTTTIYTGDLNVDAWKKGKWRSEIENTQVMVATCQIILDIIRHGYLLISEINVIIFDECHHARNAHSMYQLMSQFNNSNDTLPHVIGLTGVLVGDGITPDTVKEDLFQLENVFRSTIVTACNSSEFCNVLAFSTNPQELILKFQVDKPKPIITKVKLLVENCKTMCGGLNTWLQNLLNDFLYQIEEFGTYGASIAVLSVIISLELKKRSEELSNEKKIYRACLTRMELIRHTLVEELLSQLDESDDEDNNNDLNAEDHPPPLKINTRNMILANSNLKLRQLLYLLEKSFSEPNSSKIRCLVFVNRRFTAKCLFHLIRFFAEANPNLQIVPDFIVGHNRAMPGSIENTLESKWNKQTIIRFKRNETNLIVASNVIEEGIDLQMCNLVISFDEPVHYRSYVQTKGRARIRDSKYVALVNENKINAFIEKMAMFKEVDEKLKKELVLKIIDRPPPLEEDSDHELNKLNFGIKPFITPAGAKLEIFSALIVLNRYLMTLPKDVFTTPSITWKTEIVGSKTRVSIMLPMQSTIKHAIQSDFMMSIKAAKRSAAFNACKQLYINKELGENLLPVQPGIKTESLEIKYFQHWKKYNEKSPKKVGTKNNYRNHDLCEPDEFAGGLDWNNNNVTYNMYVIRITTDTPDHNGYLNKMQDFAILTLKAFPPLPNFSMYMTQSVVNVELSRVPIRVLIDSTKDLHALRDFHVTIFSDVLNLRKRYFLIDQDNLTNSFLIVPTLDGSKIDWSTVNAFRKISPVVMPTDKKREEMVFKPSDYLNNTVAPWYRFDNKQRYMVVKVHENLCPDSPFQNDEYISYRDYISKRYNVEIKHDNQFLIEVVGISLKSSFLSPGQDMKGAKSRSRKNELFIEFLIPELCHNFVFPGVLWIKATLLPSVLHRLHYLLLANTIRVGINKSIGLITSHPTHVEPLTIDPYIKKNADLIKKQASMDSKFFTFPNPKEMTPIKTKPVLSFADILEFPWKQNEEPIHVDSKWDSLFLTELDYYYNFLNQNPAKTTFSNTPASGLALAPGPAAANAATNAICDKPLSEYMQIKLLKLQNKEGPQLKYVLAALTTSSSGDVFDMERFEMLGDSYLKLSSSTYLLHCHPTWHEGFLSTYKGRLVSNRNLLYCAMDLRLPGMMKTMNFQQANCWSPPLLRVPRNVAAIMRHMNVSAHILQSSLSISDEEFIHGQLKSENFVEFVQKITDEPNKNGDMDMQVLLGSQHVSDKAPADCVEALIGVWVSTIGITASLPILQFFNILPKNETSLAALLKTKIIKPRTDTTVKDAQIDEYLINYELLETTIGYVFKDRGYLLQALTHPSGTSNRLTNCYEQLEFLGDAILDFLVTAYIFEQCPHMDPGRLTDLRSALVNNITLACLSVRYRFHLFMVVQNALLSKMINTFANLQAQNNHRITDQVNLLTSEEDLCFGEHVSVPKALGDIFESIIGAVFLDSNNDLLVTWNTIYRLMKTELAEMMANVPIQLVRRLYEYQGADPKFSESVVENDMVLVTVRFSCGGKILEANGIGTNRENAKKAAAKIALQQLSQT